MATIDGNADIMPEVCHYCRAMTDKGAAMQTYVTEIVQHIENFKVQRNRVSKSIADDEAKKAQLEDKITLLKLEVGRIENDLSHNINLKKSYDQIIHEAETTYMKILDSCQTLASYLMKETELLSQSD